MSAELVLEICKERSMWPAAPETLSFQSWGTWKLGTYGRAWRALTSYVFKIFQEQEYVNYLYYLVQYGSICSMLDVYITHGDPASMCCAFKHFPLLRELAAAGCPVLGHSRIWIHSSTWTTRVRQRLSHLVRALSQTVSHPGEPSQFYRTRRLLELVVLAVYSPLFRPYLRLLRFLIDFWCSCNGITSGMGWRCWSYHLVMVYNYKICKVILPQQASDSASLQALRRLRVWKLTSTSGSPGWAEGRRARHVVYGIRVFGDFGVFLPCFFHAQSQLDAELWLKAAFPSTQASCPVFAFSDGQSPRPCTWAATTSKKSMVRILDWDRFQLVHRLAATFSTIATGGAHDRFAGHEGPS